MVGGFNYLIPKSDHDGSQYVLKLGVFGSQYSLQDQTFWNIVFAEVIIDDSRKFDGSRYKNAFSVGVRRTIEI